MYRVGADMIRGCFDVPVQFDASRRTPGFLWDAFSAVLPERLRPAFRDGLERGPVHWAVNRFAPRANYGSGSVWLAGDAVGHFHPLTAAGMTLGFLDAERAGSGASLASYQEEREHDSYVPELLSNALYQVFARDDASAAQIRSAVYRVWKKSPSERQRTMRILMGAESRRSAFGAAFARMAVSALGSTVRELVQHGKLREMVQAFTAYREWAQWPAASLVPSPGRRAYRKNSTSVRPMPLPGLALGPENDVPRAPPVPANDDALVATQEVSVHDALARAGDALLAELKRLHERIGVDPDWALMRRATRIVSAIDAAQLGGSMSARMRLARRPMARLGMSRLLAAFAQDPQQIRASDVASFMLSILSPRDQETIDRLEDGVRHLLACQCANGGFAPWPHAAQSDLGTTELACRALAACRHRHGDDGAFRYQDALDRARRYLLDQQREDGSFASSELAGALSNTVHAMCALAATGVLPSSPALRRAARFLCQLQAADGTFEARADERVGSAEQREIERLERLRQAELRERAGERREQAELDRETAATERADRSP
jgi:hypothetical protein